MQEGQEQQSGRDQPNPSRPVLFWVLLTLIVAVNLLGLADGLFMGDSACFAMLSRNMAESRNFLELHLDGADWLDKPHLPFWLAALSMQFLGITPFAYKLPAVILFLLSLFYTYRLAERLYDAQVARWAVLILGSALHIVVSNNDVRAESYLLGLIMGSAYHLYCFYEANRVRDMLLGALFAGAAVMTKGLFVLLPVAGVVLGAAVCQRECRRLLQPRWLLCGLLVVLCTVPEMAAVYYQFDLHPEKTVFGRQGVSGIQFFLWDSQFGRFFNTGPIKGAGHPTFFLTAFLWAFAPWAVFAYLALGRNVLDWLRRRPLAEFSMAPAFLLTFGLFSLSRFQLPHYTNIIFPFAAILSAAFLRDVKKPGEVRWMQWTFYVHVALLGLGILLLHWLYSPGGTGLLLGLFLLAGLGAWWIWRVESAPAPRVVYGLVVLAALAGAYGNALFIPSLLGYQADSQAAAYLQDHCPQQDVYLPANAWPLEFAAANVRRIERQALLAGDVPPGTLCYVDQETLDQLRQSGRPWQLVETFHGFHITKVTVRFLNHATRATTLTPKYLVAYSGTNAAR